MGSVCTCNNPATVNPDRDTMHRAHSGDSRSHRNGYNVVDNGMDNLPPVNSSVALDSVSSESLINRSYRELERKRNGEGEMSPYTSDQSTPVARPAAAGAVPFRIVITDLDGSNVDIGLASPPPTAETQPIDSTLGGVIQWKKVADFSSLLPKNVKLKLWKGVFKNDEDPHRWNKMPEVKRITKVLRTFVMLHLTRKFKKDGKAVPAEIKQNLPMAVKQPSKFIANFLKRDESVIDETLIAIYETLCEQCKMHATDPSKKQKYEKKGKLIRENYAQLRKRPLQIEFNEEDFLKSSFLQYMLYAYQFNLDSSAAKRNNRNGNHY